jgi:hypothetical protein
MPVLLIQCILARVTASAIEKNIATFQVVTTTDSKKVITGEMRTAIIDSRGLTQVVTRS